MDTADRARLSSTELEHLRHLRRRRPARRLLVKDAGVSSAGERFADWIAGAVGSWRFIAVQSTLLVLWIAVNAWAWVASWDPYPFILLNLLLSFQAAYTAPIIMMSQNRQGEVDRDRATKDYEVNLKAELEIELLHQKLDLLREAEIVRLTGLLEEALVLLRGRAGGAAADGKTT